VSSFIDVKDGIYDPTKRFAFTNVSDKDFTFKWDGKPITIKAHKTVEMPHHLAIKATTELVDYLMQSEEQEKTARIKEKNPEYKAPNQAGSMGVPMARKPFEDRILKELKVEENSPENEMFKAGIREQIIKDLNAQPSASVSATSVTESDFAPI
jgi:hypothetical protein